MKKLFGILWIISTVGLYSCKKQEGITATEPPHIDFSSVENPFQEDSIIHAAKGKTFTIEALLLDQVGIKSFNVYYPDWYLNNTEWIAQVIDGSYREYYSRMYEGR
jgi:hypothetical protein